MDAIFDGIRWIHIVLGFAGLGAFWVAAVARKGGTLHIRAGRAFEWSAYVVAGSAIFNALGRLGHAIISGATLAQNREAFGFLIFLAYIGIFTLAVVRHGVRGVRAKEMGDALWSPTNAMLAVLSILGSVAVVVYAVAVWSSVSIVLLALSPIGALQGTAILSQMRSQPTERMGWFYLHLNNMIGAGIAFHTAFLVFGFNRILPVDLPGLWQVLPWVLPAAIGTPIQRVVENRYRRRFREPRGGRSKAGTSEVPVST